MPDKTLVIGLDGATLDLIKPWAAEGHLPTLNRLLNEGVHGELQSTIPPMTGPAWTSFATGTNPGQHRLYDWVARESDSYKFSPVTALDATMPTIYSLLSRLDRRVCAFNVPMTYPPVPVNGVMVSGMPAPSTDTTITYPESLFEEILQETGDYILYPDPGGAYSDSGVDDFLKRLYRCTDLRLEALAYLRQREDWDFTMVVFNGTDTISHAMWKFMDANHPLHDPSKQAKYGTAIRDYYQYLDKHLGDIVDNLSDDTTLILMSDHGFGPFHKFIHVNNWLIQEGFMNIKPTLASKLKQTVFNLGFSPMNVYNILMKFGLGGLKKGVVRGNGQGLLKTLFLSFADIDWQRTPAYSLGNVGQIYLNVIGREPHGCVSPGQEYEQTRDQIIERLKLLKDPETGETVVEEIYKREDVYSGDQLDKAPDIVFIPRRLEYFGFGEFEFGSHKIIEPMVRGISGTHRMNGLFMAYGKAIKSGVQVESAHLVDMAPTILRLMGIPAPDHMDGRVLTEILQTEATPLQSDIWYDGDSNGTNGTAYTNGDALSDEEEAILTERLRSLGYVG